MQVRPGHSLADPRSRLRRIQHQRDHMITSHVWKPIREGNHRGRGTCQLPLPALQPPLPSSSSPSPHPAVPAQGAPIRVGGHVARARRHAPTPQLRSERPPVSATSAACPPLTHALAVLRHSAHRCAEQPPPPAPHPAPACAATGVLRDARPDASLSTAALGFIAWRRRPGLAVIRAHQRCPDQPARNDAGQQQTQPLAARVPGSDGPESQEAAL